MRNKGCCLLLGVLVATTSVGETYKHLKVTVGDYKRSVPSIFLGFNGKITTAGKNPWQRRNRLLQTLERSSVRSLSYPGNDVSNYWDYSLGWIKQSSSDPNDKSKPLPKWVNKVAQSTNRYTLDDLALAYRITQVTPIFELNIVTGTRSELPALLNAIKQKKLPLKYVVLGNAYYSTNDAATGFDEAFPSGKVYAHKAEHWLDIIKSHHRAIKVAAAIKLNMNAMEEPTTKKWNEAVDDDVEGADAYATQFYFDSGIPPLQTAGKSITWGTQEEQDAVFKQFLTLEPLENLLAQPYVAWANDLQNTPLLGKTNKPIWIMGFNLADSIGVVRNTWAHALTIANTINLFLQDKRVDMALLNNVYSIYPKYTAIFPPNDIFLRLKIQPLLHRYVGRNDLKTTGWDLTAAGQVMQLFSQALENRDIAQQLTFDPAPKIVAGEQEYPGVYGWLFTNSKSQQTRANAVLVNEMPYATTVDLSELPLGKYRWYRQYDDKPRNYVVSENSVVRVNDRLHKQLKLMPYSITVIN